MIGLFYARFRELARSAGPAVVGVVGVAAGVLLVRRFVDDQLEHLAILGKQAYQLQTDIARATAQVEDLQDQAAAEAAAPVVNPYAPDGGNHPKAAGYPAREDLDPVDRAAEPRYMADQR